MQGVRPIPTVYISGMTERTCPSRMRKRESQIPICCGLEIKTLGSLITSTGRTSERTIAPAASTLADTIRLTVVTAGAGRSSENLGESEESKGQAHGFERDGSHFVRL